MGKIKGIMIGTILYFIIIPIIVLYGLGFILGPEIADHLPNWFGWWFVASISLLVCIALIQTVLEKFKSWIEKSRKHHEKIE